MQRHVISIFGGSGSGKSTLAQIDWNVVRPQLRLDGLQPVVENVRRIMEVIGD